MKRCCACSRLVVPGHSQCHLKNAVRLSPPGPGPRRATIIGARPTPPASQLRAVGGQTEEGKADRVSGSCTGRRSAVRPEETKGEENGSWNKLLASGHVCIPCGSGICIPSGDYRDNAAIANDDASKVKDLPKSKKFTSRCFEPIHVHNLRVLRSRSRSRIPPKCQVRDALGVNAGTDESAIKYVFSGPDEELIVHETSFEPSTRLLEKYGDDGSRSTFRKFKFQDGSEVVHVHSPSLSSSEQALQILIREMQFHFLGYGQTVWESAIGLAAWLKSPHREHILQGLRVLEVGCGCGLPGQRRTRRGRVVGVINRLTGLSAVQSFFTKEMVFSDWDGERGEVEVDKVVEGILGNLACNLMLNDLGQGVSIRRMNWFDAVGDRSEWDQYDAIIGSDLLYEDVAVAPLLETVRKSLAEGGKFFLFAPASRALSRYLSSLSLCRLKANETNQNSACREFDQQDERNRQCSDQTVQITCV
eukprot:768783-Hanusia_phi.AAC.6